MNKKIVCILLALSAAVMCHAEQWSMTFTTSTVCIPVQDPAGAGKTVTAWSAGAVTTGSYYSNAAGAAYLCTIGGTASVEPTHSGVKTLGDSITWLRCDSFNPANGVTVCVNSGAEVHYNRGRPATTDCPWTVKKVFLTSAYSEWLFIPNSGSSVVSFITE